MHRAVLSRQHALQATRQLCSGVCRHVYLSVSQAEYKQDSGKRTLVSGHIVSWEASAAFPLAQIRASLGQAGELATETQVGRSPQCCSTVL